MQFHITLMLDCDGRVTSEGTSDKLQQTNFAFCGKVVSDQLRCPVHTDSDLCCLRFNLTSHVKPAVQFWESRTTQNQLADSFLDSFFHKLLRNTSSHVPISAAMTCSLITTHLFKTVLCGATIVNEIIAGHRKTEYVSAYSESIVSFSACFS